MLAAPLNSATRTDLQHLLASRVPLIVIESREEARIRELVRAAGQTVRRQRQWAMFQWSVTEGMRRLDGPIGAPQRHLAEPLAVLRHLQATPVAGIYVLFDFHPYLSEPVHVRILKEVAQDYGRLPRTVVLVSHEVTLPAELEHLVARLKIALPDAAERRHIVAQVAKEWATRHAGKRLQIDPQALDALVTNLAGVTAADVERLARQAIVNDGVLGHDDLPQVLRAKYELLNRSGRLSYEPDTAQFSDLAGMARLRKWLTQRKPAFGRGGDSSLDPPKGVLLLGVQGCGKSMAAKAAAGLFGVPLLKLDFGALYDKWQGESERNLREALQTAAALAPCVLWIDEIEKGLATGDGDSGVSRRLLGTFLTWLADKREPVFVVATANDIAALPPELIRKGRFDEIFFVDLPGL
ncbi:MAG: AAA family ATPase, partial [Steroidobacteraceae bacterium]|nr:AAA family ATPase [Steroidobacteraceae bacterium]MDW8260703.1 AAA family ATPase [Gammaproteobacteria bacterium]